VRLLYCSCHSRAAPLIAGRDGFLKDGREVLRGMQTAAGIPLHTNGAERDIRRLARETVNENLPVAIGEGFTALPEDLL
jgi:hypothetical protein